MEEQQARPRGARHSTGFGDALAQAFELVVTPAALRASSAGSLDGRLGTAPLFMVAFGVFGFVGCRSGRSAVYYRRMKDHEAHGAERAEGHGHRRQSRSHRDAATSVPDERQIARDLTRQAAFRRAVS